MIRMSEEYTRESVTKTIDSIKREIKKRKILNNENKVIKIEIDTYGGCLDSCMMLIDFMEQMRKYGYKFYIHATGRCMSSGFYTMIHGDYRVANENCNIMCHDQNFFAFGNKSVKDVRVMARDTEKTWKKLKKMITINTKITEDILEDYIHSHEDFYMTASEAKYYGVIDEVL